MRRLALLLLLASTSVQARQADTIGGDPVKPDGQTLAEPKAGQVRVEGRSTELQLADAKSTRLGRTTRGLIGYDGPRLPLGDLLHRYYVALSEPLDLKLGASREDLLAPPSGKALARGGIVGTFAQPAPPPKR